MQKRRRWVFHGAQKAQNIKESVLHSKGINKKDWDKFLNPSLSNLHDFTMLEGVNEAVKRIDAAIKNEEIIVFYHDYDADGIGGGAVAKEMIEELGGIAKTYSNDRFKQGYGMCISGIDEIIELYGENILVITIDNGIAQVEAANYLKEKSIDLIITDHHEPQEILPHAVSIVNPKLSKKYPFRELCGAGVVWKLLSELYPNKYLDTEKYLDIVALSTVADVVPLLDENRVIVSKGLEIINSCNRPFFEVMKNATEVDEVNSHYTLGFVYGPILNAIGRLGGNIQDAIYALTSKEITNKMSDIIYHLVLANDKRKEMTTEQMEIAEEMLEEMLEKNGRFPSVIVLQNDVFHQGIVGLIAGRLKEKYNRPTIIFSADDNGVAKASARSIDALNLMDALKYSEDLLIGYGGHAPAAGMSIKIENINKFRERINEYVNKVLVEDDFVKEYSYVYQVSPNMVNIDLVNALNELAPFGKDFEKPLIRLCGFKSDPDKVLFMGSEKNHLKLKDNSLDLIVWNGAELYNERIKNPNNINCLGYPEINVWRNQVNMQFIVSGDNIY